MAPKRSGSEARGKAALEAEEPASFRQSGSLKPALSGYRITEAKLAELHPNSVSLVRCHHRQTTGDATFVSFYNVVAFPSNLQCLLIVAPSLRCSRQGL